MHSTMLLNGPNNASEPDREHLCSKAARFSVANRSTSWSARS